MSVELWKEILDWVAVVLVGLTFVAGAGALIAGKILNDRQAERLRQFDKDLTDAKIELEKQQERAAIADGKVVGLEKAASDAKTAQQRVETEMAKQQERAAVAENALLKLRESLKDRTISDAQQKVVVEALRNAPSGAVDIWWTASDTDSYGLVQQMVEIFRQAGWPPATERFAAGGTGNGFFIVVHDLTNAPAYAVSVQKAFKLIGIDMNGASKADVPEGKVQIFIGHKTPAK